MTLDAFDEFVRENLRVCREKISKTTAKPATANPYEDPRCQETDYL
jgi:hypothetical protein